MSRPRIAALLVAIAIAAVAAPRVATAGERKPWRRSLWFSGGSLDVVLSAAPFGVSVPVDGADYFAGIRIGPALIHQLESGTFAIAYLAYEASTVTSRCVGAHVYLNQLQELPWKSVALDLGVEVSERGPGVSFAGCFANACLELRERDVTDGAMEMTAALFIILPLGFFDAAVNGGR